MRRVILAVSRESPEQLTLEAQNCQDGHILHVLIGNLFLDLLLSSGPTSTHWQDTQRCRVVDGR